jgi:RNA polymerase sigma factor (sigma-70 family)
VFYSRQTRETTLNPIRIEGRKVETSDEMLMEQYRQGSNAALEMLFERRAVSVHSFLLRMVRNSALADDLLQTTFLSVVRSIDRYQKGAKVMPWLLAIAANAARDTMRRNRLHIENLSADGELPDSPIFPSMSDPGARVKIEAAFAALPAQQREVVLMHKLNGIPFDEIALALDISETAARLRAHRGYEKLKSLLGEMLES